MTTQRTPDELVEDKQVKRYIQALKKRAKAFQYCHPNTIKEMVSMLEELLRHRDQEHDAYWGENDD